MKTDSRSGGGRKAEPGPQSAGRARAEADREKAQTGAQDASVAERKQNEGNTAKLLVETVSSPKPMEN